MDFAIEEWSGHDHGGGTVPMALAEPIGPATARMRGTDQAKPRCAALVGTVGVQARCGIHEWRPSPCREFGLRAPMGIGDEACDAARRRHGLPALGQTGPHPQP